MAERDLTQKNRIFLEGVVGASIPKRREALLERTLELLETGDRSALRLILNSQGPADLLHDRHGVAGDLGLTDREG